ncbi:MAG: hypothetical protein V4819_21320 [Verrucomicrobiota bacterium]
MKSSQSRRGFLLAVLAGSCLLQSVSSAAVTVTVLGSGPDSSFLVLESPNLGVRTYEIRYTYNSGNQDGYFLLSQVLASNSSITTVMSNYGTPSVPNYITDSFTLNSLTEANTPWPDPGPAWSHWVSGGQAGWPTAAPIASGTWQFGSGMSSPFRSIEPGSWDAFYYSDGLSSPSVAPIPEMSSAMLGILGSLVTFRRRRNR